MGKFRVGIMDDGFFERFEKSGSFDEALAGCSVREMSLEELAERLGVPTEPDEQSRESQGR